MRISDWSSYVCSSDLHPIGQLQSAGRGIIAHEDERDHAEFGAPGIAHLDAHNIRIARANQLAIAFDVAIGIEQRAQRRFADRPALDLLDLVIDKEQRAPVRSDERRAGKEWVSTGKYRG